MTEKHKNPTNVPILKKFHQAEHAQLAFENASKPTFSLHVTKLKILQVTGLRMLMIPFACEPFASFLRPFACDERRQHAGKR